MASRTPRMPAGYLADYVTASSILIPSFFLQPTPETEELLKHMAAPVEQRSAFEGQMRELRRMLLYNVAVEAVVIARAVLMGGPYGSAIETSLARATWVTRTLRDKNRNNDHPLKETGALARSLIGVVTANGSSATVGVPSGISAFGRRGHAVPGGLSQLALNLEQGYKLNITAKAKRWFKMQAEDLQDQERPAGISSWKKDKRSGQWYNPQAAAWWYLAKKPEGVYSMPARPFLQPSVMLAAERTMQRTAPQFAQFFMDLLTRGTKDQVQKVGRVKIQGVTIE